MTLKKITFVAESISTNMTNEGLGPCVLPVVIVEFGLRLKALGADIANELAIGGMQFGVPLEERGLFKAFVTAFKVTYKGLGGPGDG